MTLAGSLADRPSLQNHDLILKDSHWIQNGALVQLVAPDGNVVLSYLMGTMQLDDGRILGKMELVS